jgi:endonuclease YncB( thermonuclease family)
MPRDDREQEQIKSLAFGANVLADTQVKDGDDIIIDGQDYRFVTVDAFEQHQTCKDDKGSDYDCGARAKKALEEIIGNQLVQCQSFKGDDRKISRCSAGNVDLEVAIVRAGWAFPRRDFRPHDPERFAELCGVEKEAREAKRGEWAGTFDIPFVRKTGSRDKVPFVSCPEFPNRDRRNRAPSERAEQEPSGDVLPHWVRLLTALLTPAIALLAVVIGWAQWRTTKRREVMELFERRMLTEVRLLSADRGLLHGLPQAPRVYVRMDQKVP